MMIVLSSKAEIRQFIGKLIDEEVIDSTEFVVIDMEDSGLLTERADASSIVSSLFPEGICLAGKYVMWNDELSDAKLQYGKCFLHRFSSTGDFLKAIKSLPGDHVYGPAALFDDALRWGKDEFRVSWHFDILQHTLRRIDHYRVLCEQGEHYDELLFIHPAELDRVMRIISAL